VKPSCCLNSLLLWDKITGASSLSVDSCHHVWTPPTTCGVLKSRIPPQCGVLKNGIPPRVEFFNHVWSPPTMCGSLSRISCLHGLIHVIMAVRPHSRARGETGNETHHNCSASLLTCSCPTTEMRSGYASSNYYILLLPHCSQTY